MDRNHGLGPEQNAPKGVFLVALLGSNVCSIPIWDDKPVDPLEKSLGIPHMDLVQTILHRFIILEMACLSSMHRILGCSLSCRRKFHITQLQQRHSLQVSRIVCLDAAMFGQILSCWAAMVSPILSPSFPVSGRSREAERLHFAVPGVPGGCRLWNGVGNHTMSGEARSYSIPLSMLQVSVDQRRTRSQMGPVSSEKWRWLVVPHHPTMNIMQQIDALNTRNLGDTVELHEVLWSINLFPLILPPSPNYRYYRITFQWWTITESQGCGRPAGDLAPLGKGAIGGYWGAGQLSFDHDFETYAMIKSWLKWLK